MEKKSLIQHERECYFCGTVNGLERHHVLGGFSSKNRQFCETYGLWVWVCRRCHTGPDGVQYDARKNLELKRTAQRVFTSYYGRNVWMMLFRKNYLTEQEGKE